MEIEKPFKHSVIKTPRTRAASSSDEEMPRTVTMPLTVTEEIVTRLSQDDVDWSFALREFEGLPEPVLDAAWQLLQHGNPAVLRALSNILSKQIARKILNNGITPIANLDLVESKEALVLDESSLNAAAKVQAMLYEMENVTFLQREIKYVVRNTGEELTIKNRTWMTQAVVESLLSTFEHSHLRKTVGLDEAAISNLLKNGTKLHPYEYDIFHDLMRVSFDQVILLRPTYKGDDKDLKGKISNYVSLMAAKHVDFDYTGTIPRKVDYKKFVELIVSASREDSSFMTLLFCYLYPDETRLICDMFLEAKTDKDYENYGAQTLESYIDCIAAAEKGSKFLKFSEVPEVVDEGRVERMMELSQDLECTSPTAISAAIDIMHEIDPDSYHAKVLERCELTMGDVTAEAANLLEVYKGKIPENGIVEMATQYWRYQRLVGLGEWNRLMRVARPDVRSDEMTQDMADLFPDQYEFFHSDLVTKDLLDPEMSEVKVISNSIKMIEKLKSTMPKQKIDAELVCERTAAFQAHQARGDVLLMDLNTGIIDTRDLPGARIMKTWTSPLALEKGILLEGLTTVCKLMGVGFGGAPENRLNAWVRVPIPTDFASFCLLNRIIVNELHSVAVYYPKRMHETYLDLRIYPVSLPKSVVTDKAKFQLYLVEKLLYMGRILDHFALHLFEGIQARHIIWDKATRREMCNWKSHRFKHLKALNFAIDIDLEKKKIVKHIQVFKANMHGRKNNAKLKAEKKKELIMAYAAQSKIMAAMLTAGIRPAGMRDLDGN